MRAAQESPGPTRSPRGGAFELTVAGRCSLQNPEQKAAPPRWQRANLRSFVLGHVFSIKKRLHASLSFFPFCFEVHTNVKIAFKVPTIKLTRPAKGETVCFPRPAFTLDFSSIKHLISPPHAGFHFLQTRRYLTASTRPPLGSQQLPAVGNLPRVVSGLPPGNLACFFRDEIEPLNFSKVARIAAPL